MAEGGARLDPAFYNRAVRHGRERYRHRLDAIFAAWARAGFLPGTEPPTKGEELAMLRQQLPQIAQVVQGATDEFERIDAMRKLDRWQELEERVGETQGTQG